MVRRVILGSLFAGFLAVAVFAAEGCVDDSDPIENDCDKRVPIACCQCSLPDFCPPWSGTEWPKLPAWCEPLLADAGIDVNGDIFDSGMSSLCSSGTCVPPAPEAWKHVAFAMTWPALPPACPEDAPNQIFEGSPAPADRLCPKCSCDAPEGTCSLPTTWAVSSEVCPGGGGIKTNFDPPTGWDGTCDVLTAIAQGKLCGGVPCVQSLTISPPVIEEKPCVSHTEGEGDLPVLRARSGGPDTPIGRACASNDALPRCSGAGCASTNSAFGACIMRDGDQVCPDGWTGARHVLYGNIEDSRECSPCGCDAPQGGSCQIKWRTFSSSSCSVESASKVISTGMMPEPCWDFVAGEALAGKAAEIVDHTKGSCAPNGGDPVGEIKLDKQVTVCCLSTVM